MINQRRRRAILVGLTTGLILLGQAPNVYLNLTHRSSSSRHQSDPKPSPDSADRPSRLDRRSRLEHLQAAHRWIPPLWLPYGAQRLAEHRSGPVLWAAAGLFFLGGLGLHRAYRGTLRFYLGAPRSRRASRAATVRLRRPPGRSLLERRLRFLPEPADVLALAFFRSFLRAPEAKMALVAPLIMVVAFGLILIRRDEATPELVRVLIPTALGFFILLGLIQLFANQFGFDRNGFRALVLSPAPRHYILLGKNLVLLVFALGMELTVLALLMVVSGVSWADWLSGLMQFLTGFLCFCILGNLASILAPWRIAAGSLKPTKMPVRGKLMVLGFHLLFPTALLPTLLPLVWQVVCTAKGWWPGIPFHAVGSALTLAVALPLYLLSLGGFGRLLQSREVEILQVVTHEVE